MSVLNHKLYSKAHIERIHYYSPSPRIKNYEPIQQKFNTNLKIGLIGSERIYNGFKFEAEVFILKEDNWKTVLQYVELDFLLIESCSHTVSGDWEYAQIEETEKNKILKKLVLTAKKNLIPTVYWFTEDCTYHNNYKDFIPLVDYVFCADYKEIELLRNEGIKADVLLPAVQPIIYNPFKDYEYYNELDIDVLFDGWSDIYRFEKELSVLKKIKEYGLKIIDSKKEIFHTKLKDVPEYIDNILGCVSLDSRKMILKYSKVAVSFKETLSTETTQQWDALEIIASQTSLFYRGKLNDNDIRKRYAVEIETDEELVLKLSEFQSNNALAEQQAHLAWREVNDKHTFNLRLMAISRKLKINVDNQMSSKASLITPTYRKTHIEQAIKTYISQKYENKELIIIYNGNERISDRVKKLCDEDESIKLVSLPMENSVGDCLNLGHSIAQGEFCFRIDDDDIYGENYILDMMLYLRASEHSLFGCPPGYISCEDSNEVYSRRNNIYPLSVVKSEEILKGNVYLGGNTIGGKRSFLLENPYPSLSFGAADTSLLLEASHKISHVLIMDLYNMLVIRRNDSSSHTWRIDCKEMKKNLIALDSTTKVFI